MEIKKKGLVIEIIAFMVVAFIMLLFFAGWIYGSHIINGVLTNINSTSPIGNISEAASHTYTYVDTGYSQLNLISLMILIGYTIATFIIAYFSRKHPIWIAVYVMIAIVLVIFSIYISNAYQGLLSNSTLGATLGTFTVQNFIMNYLPYWVAIISLFGMAISLYGYYQQRDNL